MCGQDRPERTPPRQLGPYRPGSCRVGRTPTNASWPVGAMSTPRNRLTGSATVGSGTSMVAYRNHLPSRRIRSVSPIACARRRTRSLGIARIRTRTAAQLRVEPFLCVVLAMYPVGVHACRQPRRTGVAGAQRVLECSFLKGQSAAVATSPPALWSSHIQRH
jgi:hypothetical protein